MDIILGCIFGHLELLMSISKLEKSMFLQQLSKIQFYIAGFIIFSVLFLPSISIGENFPTIQIVDFLLPFLVIILFLNRTTLVYFHYYIFLISFAVYIGVSIAVNGRLNQFQDLFEIYKMFKFLILILFFSNVNLSELFSKIIKPFFIVLVGINMIHYFNLFNINPIIQYHYNGELNIEFFGLNSLYEPAAKRMVGLSGSPNINAVLFGVFAIYFLPLKYNSAKLRWFLLALFMLFLCQSRTVVFAMLIIIASALIFNKTNWNIKHSFSIAFMAIVTYFISWAFATDFFKYPLYSNSMVDPAVVNSGSARGRFEVWQLLWEMIKEKPIFGYGAFKEYFYENNLFSENEYILMTWRYGFIGLLFYLSLFAFPLFIYRKIKNNSVKSKLVLTILLFLIVAITNNPFTDRLLFVSLALLLAFGFKSVEEMKHNFNSIKNSNNE